MSNEIYFFLLQIIFYTFQLMLKASNTIKLLFEKQIILLGYFRFKFSEQLLVAMFDDCLTVVSFQL